MKKFVANLIRLKQKYEICNYDKVNTQGVVPENTLIKDRDIIIAKFFQLKQ